MTQRHSQSPSTADLEITIGHDQLVISRRYETLSILNDVVIAFFFVIGSAFFFVESLSTAAKWCFLLGSIEFLVRPVIRLARRVHLQRIGSSGGAHPQDF